ncbi:MAG TPA: immunoglobulin domain-containing protein, partial [Verrucomicrobiae bacterium]|nr:immunoglobulin domain-containing protein [Verrucomicrobiae bacterium]
MTWPPRLWSFGWLILALLVPIAAQAQVTITIQPQSQTVVPGRNLVLTVGATGTGPLIYQWRLNGVNIPGATGASLTVPNFQDRNSGDYTVAVADSVDAVNSAVAQVRVSGLDALPFTDSFSGQNDIGGNVGTGRGNNTGATKQPGEPNHARKPGTNSVWVTWTPPLGGLLGGVAYFDTAGSSFDTIIAVYRGDNVTNLTLVAANDDSVECGDETRSYHTSSVRFKVELGAVYRIAVDGVAGAKGDIVLSWDVKLLENLLGLISLTPDLRVGLLGDSITLSVDLLGLSRYQWYHNCEPIPGATQNVLTIDNLQPAKVGLYFARVEHTVTGAAVNSDPVNVQINVTDGSFQDAAAQNKFGEMAELAMANPVTQQSSLQKASSRSGTVKKMSGGPASGYTGTQIFSTFGSTKEAGEPNHCGIIGGASEWYSYVPPANGVVNLNTDGSDFNTVLAVYTVPPGQPVTFQNLQSVGCSNEAGNGGDNAVFTASRDKVYYIAVDGVSGSRGTVHLNYGLNIPPTINQQPLSQTVPLGATATFNVFASGVPAPSYQWQFNGVNLDGATNNSLTLNNVQPSQAGTYRVLVSNAAATVTSAEAVLTEIEPPAIATQPQSQTVVAGTNAAFSVAVGGTAPFSFQWRFGSVTLSGATNQTLNLTNVQPAAAGGYSVVVGNAAGTTTSSNAALTVISPPVITMQPQNQTVVTGANVILDVEVSGTAPFTFQWRLDGVNLSGATNETLHLTSVAPSAAGNYSV